jgi:Fe(3+) dicitrate transport protein
MAFGSGNALTLGYTAYLSHSPYDIRHDPNPYADGDATAGALFYRDDRRTHYGAVFAESLFRLPHRIHAVLSARFDHEELATAESVAPHPDLVDSTYRKSVPLFGFGIGNDFGRGNETYFNVSQAFRPLRYLDIASPFTNFAETNNPNPTRYLEYEAGVHGWPVEGFYYDASVFQIDARDRIESQALTQVESIDVNTGDTRNRGVELESSYDVLRLAPRIAPTEHLDLFFNAQLLQARFTASAIPGQVGKTPAYAPSHLYKAGITWRQEPRWKASLVMESVGSQYFQDSDLPVAGTPARIPAYVVADLATDVYLTRRLRLLGGVSNLGDRRYYSRVFIAGGSIEPALRRAFYAGVAYDF